MEEAVASPTPAGFARAAAASCRQRGSAPPRRSHSLHAAAAGAANQRGRTPLGPARPTTSVSLAPLSPECRPGRRPQRPHSVALGATANVDS